MEKNKRTQGTFFVDAGDAISELLLRAEIKEDGNTELFDICDFSADETGNVKANAAFICEAVNNYDKLKEDNAALQKALSTLTGMHSNLKEDNSLLLEALRWITQIDRNPDNYLKLVQIAKDAIQKVKK